MKESDWEMPGNDYSDLELFPGGERTRPWAGISQDARDLVQMVALLVLGPWLFSTCLRLSVVDPVVHAVQGDMHFHLELSENQYDIIAEKVREKRERMEYDVVMDRAPILSAPELKAELKDEGLRLERMEREKALQVVSNTLSDSTSLLILVGAAFKYGARITAMRQASFKRFLGLKASTQAFVLLLLADTFVGYHSSDGWTTVLEMMYGRYTILTSEEADNLIRLFVATVPVMVDVGFKFWVYRYLRKLAPGTQIILGEIGNN